MMTRMRIAVYRRALRAAVTAKDVTELKRVAKALRGQMARLGEQLAVAPDAAVFPLNERWRQLFYLHDEAFEIILRLTGTRPRRPGRI